MTLRSTICRTATILAVMTGGIVSGLAQAQGSQDQAALPSRSIALAESALYPPYLPAPDSAEREDELERWMRDFSAWRKWNEQWSNLREPGWFSNYRKRRERPDPPAWLPDRCDDSVEDGGATAEACMLLAVWRADDATTQVTIARVNATTQNEEINKTLWWEHIHLDAAWPALQSGVTHVGVIGMHPTVSVSGRFEVFVAPGVMLLNIPTRDGTRTWKFAANYGIGYRLGQFTFPGGRQALLHVNLAKAWLFSAGPEVPTKSTDFIGLSVSFKKRPF